MMRSVAVIGAPSNIGIRPYDDGTPRRLDLAPRILRETGLLGRLRGRDSGDVVPPPYRDLVRPVGRPRNEDEVLAYSHALGARIAEALGRGEFALTLGGDCSIVLGCLLGVRRAGHRPAGLVYVDAHSDFATPENSRTGSAASMCLGLAVGRGATPLAWLGGDVPLAHEAAVVLLGRRDDSHAPFYGQDALRTSALLDLPHVTIRELGPSGAAHAALERLSREQVSGFWIHLDADVLDPAVLPAVDSPEPGGLELDEVVTLLTPLARDRRALGLALTIFDPMLDPDRFSATRLFTLLERVIVS